MSEMIYLGELECPYCDGDTYMESWDIEVEPDKKMKSKVLCDDCGKEFYVVAELSVSIEKL